MLQVFAASLPTARELENSRRDDLSLLSLPTDERNAKIREYSARVDKQKRMGFIGYTLCSQANNSNREVLDPVNALSI